MPFAPYELGHLQVVVDILAGSVSRTEPGHAERFQALFLEQQPLLLGRVGFLAPFVLADDVEKLFENAGQRRRALAFKFSGEGQTGGGLAAIKGCKGGRVSRDHRFRLKSAAGWSLAGDAGVEPLIGGKGALILGSQVRGVPALVAQLGLGEAQKAALFVGKTVGKRNVEFEPDSPQGAQGIVKQPVISHDGLGRAGKTGEQFAIVGQPQQPPRAQTAAMDGGQGHGHLDRVAHDDDRIRRNGHLGQHVPPQGPKPAHAGILDGEKRRFAKRTLDNLTNSRGGPLAGRGGRPALREGAGRVPGAGEIVQELLVDGEHIIVFPIPHGVEVVGLHQRIAKIGPKDMKTAGKEGRSGTVHAKDKNTIAVIFHCVAVAVGHG